ncbi:radical SAM protein [bacterium]|nr:radical SAM protein [bacterium]
MDSHFEDLLTIDRSNFFQNLIKEDNHNYDFSSILNELIDLRKDRSLYFEASNLLLLFWKLQQEELKHVMAKTIVDPFFNQQISPVFSLIDINHLEDTLKHNTLGKHLLFYSDLLECNIELDFLQIKKSTKKLLFAVFSGEQIDFLIQQNQYQHLLQFDEIYLYQSLPKQSHDLENLVYYSTQEHGFQKLIALKTRNYKRSHLKLSPTLEKFKQEELSSLFQRIGLQGKLRFETFPRSLELGFISQLVDGSANTAFMSQFLHLFFDDLIELKNSFNQLFEESPLYLGDTDPENNQKIFSSQSQVVPKLVELQTQKFKLYINQYNFFKLGSILQDIYQKPCCNFNVKDSRHLINDFLTYLFKLKSDYPTVLFQLYDSSLLEILHIVEQSPIHYKEQFGSSEECYGYFLRMLGITCDHAFVGPQSVHIDVTSKCNTKCTFCGYHTDLIDDKPWTKNGWSEKELDFNLFKNFVDDLVSLQSKEDVLLTGGGEPLMHPKILDMISYLRQNEIYTILFTNGLLLKKYTVNQLVDLGLNKIYWSIHSASSNTWIMQHPGANPSTFQMVIDQMKYLVEYKKAKGTQYPTIVLVNAISAVNTHEVMDLVDLAIDLQVDHLRLQVVHKHNEQTNHLLLTKYQLTELSKKLPLIEKKLKQHNILLLDNIAFQVSHLLENMDKKEVINDDWTYNKYNQSGCFIGYLFTRTWVDGTMSYCCHDRVVNHLENGFASSWNSKEYNHYRFVSKHYDDSQNILLKKNERGSWLLGKDCSSCGNYELINRAQETLSWSGLDIYTPIGINKLYQRDQVKNMDLDHQNIIFGENSYKPKEFISFGGV